MIKPNRKKFLQDIFWYVVKTLRVRENYIIQGIIICSPPAINGTTKWGTRFGGGGGTFHDAEMKEIHIFLEIGPKSRDQLEDICVVWGMIKNDRDRNISRLRLRLLASQKNKTQTEMLFTG
jgi:hypothetical protein